MLYRQNWSVSGRASEVNKIQYCQLSTYPMRTININQLQSQISRVMKDVEAGESYEVMRYSKPIAVITAKSAQKKEKDRCEECINKLDKIIMLLSLKSEKIEK
jgi:antitoxin (DNA-binding transcriptional repressor) of toxin-antitoxin stability system